MNNSNIEIKPMTIEDVDIMPWKNGERHLEYMREAIKRSETNVIDFLSIWLDGQIAGYGGIDYEKEQEAGYMWMLTVNPKYRSQGLGTKLIDALEKQVRQRGLNSVKLSVEVINPKAKALYERLGYKTIGQTKESWEQSAEDGGIEIYTTICDVMEKPL